MSSGTPVKGHRNIRSGAVPGIAASSQNSRHPHHLNQQTQVMDSHAGMQSFNLASSSQPSTPPRTPRKDNEVASHLLSSAAASGPGSKQKSRNKTRPKNVLTSPIITRNDRVTSPSSGIQSAGMPSASRPVNTPTTAAYAGPTFHASPAPSALPMPSFYSKSVPDSPSAKGLKLMKDNHQATPPLPAPATQSQREESPLDFFFKADREEKARAHSARQMAGVAGPFQPPDEPSRSSQTPPAGPIHSQTRQGSMKRMSSGGIFSMEMDSAKDAGTPFGPAFSTPYSERINAARNKQQSKPSEQSNAGSRASLSRSEALKAYLFSGTSISKSRNSEDSTSSSQMTTNAYPSLPTTYNSSGNIPLPQRSYPDSCHAPESKHQSSSHRPAARSSGLRQEVASTKSHIVQYHNTSYKQGPNHPQRPDNAPFGDASQLSQSAHTPTPAAGSENRSADLLGMEDSLRKILKLDLSGSSSATR